MTDLTSDFLASDEALVLLPKGFESNERTKPESWSNWSNGSIEKGTAILAKKIPATEKFLLVMVAPQSKETSMVDYYQRLEIGLKTLLTSPSLTFNSVPSPSSANEKSQQIFFLPKRGFETTFEIAAVVDPKSLADMNAHQMKLTEDAEKNFHLLSYGKSEGLDELLGVRNSSFKKMREWVC